VVLPMVALQSVPPERLLLFRNSRFRPAIPDQVPGSGPFRRLLSRLQCCRLVKAPQEGGRVPEGHDAATSGVGWQANSAQTSLCCQTAQVCAFAESPPINTYRTETNAAACNILTACASQ
jgi:hypothetical protein